MGKAKGIELLQRTELFEEESTRPSKKPIKGRSFVMRIDNVKNDETG